LVIVVAASGEKVVGAISIVRAAKTAAASIDCFDLVTTPFAG